MLNKLHIFYSMLAAFLAAACGGCSSANSTRHIPAVENFELSKYMGKWYEIARLPHSFERNVSHAEAEYTLQDNGKVKVVNRGLRNGQSTSATGSARFIGPTDRGELEVCFFYPFYGKYKIIYLEKDYQSAIVTGDNTNYAWILARTSKLPPEKLIMYLKKLQAWGFATELMQYPWGIDFSL